MPMRFASVFVFCCAPLLAQFQNLVTNDDGSVLYFSSALRQRGSEQPTHPKLFVLNAAGLRLYLQRPFERTTSPDATWPVSTYYSLESVALNASGSQVAVIARRDCFGGSGCLPTPKIRSEIGELQYRGRMSLSRNGRYALLSEDGSILSPVAVLDLQTGDRRNWLFPRAARSRYGRRQVSSSGVAVTVWSNELRVSTIETDRTITLPAAAENLAIDDAGRVVVFESELGVGLVDLTTNESRYLGGRSGEGVMQPCLSNDGRTVLYMDGGQAFLITTDTSAARRLTNEPAGIREVVLSGDGQVAYATTGSGRLLRIRVESGVVEELIGQTPILQMNFASGSATPGSAFTVRGAGFASSPASATPPLPVELNGVRLLLDGLPVPLQTVEPERIVFQIPWETATGAHRLEIVTEANGNFETEPVTLEIQRTVFGQFETLGREHGVSLSLMPFALAAHGDFSSVVTPANPARPGEIVHLYMTGLGPVAPAVRTGDPAPVEPLAQLIAPVRCTVYDTEADVLFAGLAPGFVGYYQVSIRIPAEVQVSQGEALLACRPAGPETGESRFLPVK